MTEKISSNHLVVIKIRAMGDTLLATPSLRALRKAYPEAGISVVVSPQGKAILEGNPDVDRIFVYEEKNLGYSLSFLRKLSQSKYDLAIALHASLRTALMARATGARQRIVHNHSGSNFFSTIPITAKKESKSTIQRDLDAVRALGVPEAGEDLVFPIAKDDFQNVYSFFEEQRIDPKQPLWLLAPGAGKQRKQWSAKAAADFLVQVSKYVAGTWILLDDPTDHELARAIAAKIQQPIPVFSQEIKEVGAMMSLCKGVVTADSGPKHVAVAVGTKTLTLWTDEPVSEWHPYSMDKHALITSPTGIVEDLSAEYVLEAARQHFKDA
jgi:ADP-heptose:LPS heptosyltransferase